MNKEEIIKEYREKHPRCSWCVFYEYHSKCFGEFRWSECYLKEEGIYHEKLKARLCKQYYVDEEKIKDEISTNKNNES